MIGKLKESGGLSSQRQMHLFQSNNEQFIKMWVITCATSCVNNICFTQLPRGLALEPTTNPHGLWRFLRLLRAHESGAACVR